MLCFIVMSDVTVKLSATLGLHLYSKTTNTLKKLMREACVVKEVVVAPVFIFIANECVQHAGSEWRGKNCNPYKSYSIPKHHVLSDAVAFAYRRSIASGPEK